MVFKLTIVSLALMAGVTLQVDTGLSKYTLAQIKINTFG